MCTSVPHGDKHIFIFNIIEHKGAVYNIIHGKKMKEIQPPSMHLGDNFHSLNPLSFIFYPNFMINLACASMIRLNVVILARKMK
jgi:hypothetical protein